jgi:hypothetical protein
MAGIDDRVHGRERKRGGGKWKKEFLLGGLGPPGFWKSELGSVRKKFRP